METVKIEGLVYKIGQVERKSDKFSVQKIVLETIEENQTYAQLLEIQFVNDRADSLEYINLGDKVLVTLSLRGREWKAQDGTVRYFNTLNGEAIQKRETSRPTPTSAPTPDSTDPFSDELFNFTPTGQINPNL